jgi:hypothetical protein
MKNDIQVQFEDYFTVIPPQNLLICNTCRYAVSKTEIAVHLARRHKQQIPPSTRQTLRRLGSASIYLLFSRQSRVIAGGAHHETRADRSNFA